LNDIDAADPDAAIQLEDQDRQTDAPVDEQRDRIDLGVERADAAVRAQIPDRTLDREDG
jgi:hypothetical protein